MRSPNPATNKQTFIHYPPTMR